jgi:hypothetical protein
MAEECTHAWEGCTCTKCGAKQHDYKLGACTKCGEKVETSVMIVPGRGLGISVDKKTCYYKAPDAKRMLVALAGQFTEDGKPRGQSLYLATPNGPVEITAADAIKILMTVGELAQSGMLDIVAG